tara:strand:- start:344 stop:1207 length:864 start_codon:yes stop_codon:yes gene_type:complete
MKKKIIIGTAQFGMKYGVSKKSICPSPEQKKIIKFSLKNKNFYFDTSPYYVKNNNFFKRLRGNKIKIIFKLNADDLLNKLKKFDNDFNKFKINFLNKYSKQIEVILIYNFEEITHKDKKSVYKFLNLLKQKKIIKQYGYSTYNLKKIKKFCKVFKPDIIQCPFNIIDTRLYKHGYLEFFKKLNIKIHVRSIFLQGLLLMEKKQISKNLKNKKTLNKWFDWIEMNNMNPSFLCCNFVSFFKQIDKFVIGFHNVKQMKEIFNFKYNKKYMKLPCFTSSDLSLIHPGKWK